jgi:hypothetical protein
VSWLASLGIAFLTGIVALVASGLVSALAVEWYRISSFEGGSGFFVVFTAFFGGVAGAVIGLIAARITAVRSNPSFLKCLCNSVGVVLVLLLAIAGTARVLADVPPEIDGETLLLHIELRSPVGDATDLTALPGQPYVRMGALAPFSNVERVNTQGPLWIEDLRREDGRWIVPGAVEIFTSRGKKVVDAGIGDKILAGFLTPLPGSPSRRDLDWSDWFPHPRQGEPPLPDQFAIRYRVVRAADPVRTVKAGPFEIDQIIREFYQVAMADGFAARSTFTVRHRGQPVPGLERLDGVSVVAGPLPALVVRVEDRDAAEACRLVVERDGQPNVTTLSACAAAEDATPLTADTPRYRAARERKRLPGWIDRVAFETPGLYLFPDAVLDSRTLTSRRVTVVGPSNETPNVNVPPLGISPDERSIAWYANSSDDQPQIGVTDTIDGRNALLPIGRARMRFANFDQLDPAWLLHHFEWQRGNEGFDTLEPRAGFVPLPYHGEFSTVDDYTSYQLEPAGAALRKALEEWLVTELKAVELPGNTPDEFSHAFSVDGVAIDVMFSEGSDYVSISFPTGQKGDPKLIEGIGKQFDEALKTGKYDELFGRQKE